MIYFVSQVYLLKKKLTIVVGCALCVTEARQRKQDLQNLPHGGLWARKLRTVGKEVTVSWLAVRRIS